jgi:hypothetical protein
VEFACVGLVFVLVYRLLAGPNQWRRRESNPRPQPHRLSVYKLRLPFRFARRPGCSRPTAGLADPSVSRFGRSALPPRRARSLAPPPSHGQSRGGVATLGLPRQRVRDRSSHLRCAGGFTRPTGDLGLQLIRMDRPRRNQHRTRPVSIRTFRGVISLLLEAAGFPCSVPGLGRAPLFNDRDALASANAPLSTLSLAQAPPRQARAGPGREG